MSEAHFTNRPSPYYAYIILGDFREWRQLTLERHKTPVKVNAYTRNDQFVNASVITEHSRHRYLCWWSGHIGRYTLSNHYVPVPNVTKIRIKLEVDIGRKWKRFATLIESSKGKVISVNFTISYNFFHSKSCKSYNHFILSDK